eukprot:748309-Hanusia_phi.AAC.11
MANQDVSVVPDPRELGAFQEIHQHDPRDIGQQTQQLVLRQSPAAPPQEAADPSDQLGAPSGVKLLLPPAQHVVQQRPDVVGTEEELPLQLASDLEVPGVDLARLMLPAQFVYQVPQVQRVRAWRVCRYPVKPLGPQRDVCCVCPLTPLLQVEFGEGKRLFPGPLGHAVDSPSSRSHFLRCGSLPTRQDDSCSSRELLGQPRQRR